jgi:hypothetical protein
MTGISSSFFAAAGVQKGWNLELILRLVARYIPRWILPIPDIVKLFPNAESYKYWSPVTGGESRQLQFADGGLLDNTGVIGLLRRGCKTIIACVSSDSAVVCGEPLARFSDIAALFGRAKEDKSSKIGSINDMSKVFDPKEWDVLLDDLKGKYNNGKPQVCKMQLEVLPNEYAGIYRGDTVEIYFCVNGRCTDWFNKIGEGAKSLKEKMKPGNVPFIGPEPDIDLKYLKPAKLTENFPYFSTFRVIYDQDVVNMMAHNCAYGIKTGLEDLGFDVGKIPP